MGRQRGRSFSPSVFSCRSLCFFLPACLSLCGFTRQVSPFPLPLQKKKCGVGSVFCFGGGGKAGGRGWKSGIPSGGDAQRWQLRENESNPSNPPPFQPPIRCFQKPHIFFFTIYSDFLFLFPALCLLFIPIRPFLSRCCALLLPCFARSSLLRTPGRQDPQCATNTPRPPPPKSHPSAPNPNIWGRRPPNPCFREADLGPDN